MRIDGTLAVNGEFEAGYDLLTRLAPSGAEDFITEVLCWLLDSTDFGDRFLAKLTEIDDATVPEVGAGCRWATQERYELDGTVKRPDMVCESADRNTALIFEHKVGADLHDRQLENYRRIGEREYGSSGLILITARKSQGDDEADCHLLWREVHGWLSEWLCTAADDAGAFVARSFLALLEERGLGPMEEITVEQLRAIPAALAGEQRIKLLVNRVAEHPVWQDLVAGVPDETAGTVQDKRERDSRWGRLGLYLLGGRSTATWSPGVFVGVLQDNSDHGPPSVNDQQGSGPVACLIVDVAKSWHGRYETSEAYSRLADALRRHWPGGAADDWQVYEYKRNRWHPLTVYKPLEAVFRAARTGDGQVDRFVEEVGGVAKAVLDLEEFSQFKRSLV